MYQLDSQSYFSNIREDIISVLKNYPANRLLEVGAGGCGTIVEIKKRGLAKHVTAAELFKIENSQQNDPSIDSFLNLDLNSELNDLPDNTYDLIIAADVLEHLVDPWKTLNLLRAKLTSDGTVIISLPNIRNLKTLKKIVLDGTFAYENEGVLDRTHLRFFCLKDMKNLFLKAGFKIEKIEFSSDKKMLWIKSFLPTFLKELLSTQIITVLKQGRR